VGQPGDEPRTMSQNPDQRDKAIARLAAEALSSGSSATDASCPDAEVLAAYAERGLEPNEAAYWERHFADCGRCRKTLALLAVSAEALTQKETQPRIQPADVTPLPVAAKPKQPIARPRHSPLRWLVPALGVAAAIAMWFALRPIPPATQTVAELQKEAQNVIPNPTPNTPPAAPTTNSPVTNSPATNSQATNSRAADSEVARAELPSPPPAAPESSAKQIEPLRDLNELKKDNQEPAAPAASSAAPPADGESARIPAPAEAGQAQPRPQTFSAAAPRAAPPSAPAPSNATAAKSLDRLNAPAGILGRGQTGAANGLGAIQVVVFASPDRGALWRSGAGGRIERSIDQGRSWQPQASGVTADLLAGAAVSSQVAWIVGRGGVILRTTDGATWQRISPPMGPTLDWTSIEATDGQHATITSADLRRFSTADGGRTWTPQ
jgi:hypothetical protein